MPDWFCLLLCVLMLVPWVLLLAAYFHDFHYRFPVFAFPGIIMTVLNLLAPFIPIAVSGVLAFLGKKSRKWWSLLCLILFFPLILATFLGYWGEVLAAPTVWSETTDVENLGQYDAFPGPCIESVPAELFPREIPGDAENVQYRYRFANASADELYMAISWQYEDAEKLWQIQSDLEQYGDWTVNSEGEWVLHCDDPMDTIYLYVAVILNPDQNRVYYVAVRQRRPLPEKSEEVLLGTGRSESPYDYGHTGEGK